MNQLYHPSGVFKTLWQGGWVLWVWDLRGDQWNWNPLEPQIFGFDLPGIGSECHYRWQNLMFQGFRGPVVGEFSMHFCPPQNSLRIASFEYVTGVTWTSRFPWHSCSFDVGTSISRIIELTLMESKISTKSLNGRVEVEFWSSLGAGWVRRDPGAGVAPWYMTNLEFSIECHHFGLLLHCIQAYTFLFAAETIYLPVAYWFAKSF